MAEVLASFTTPVRDDFGSYYARAVGRAAADHMWEGWLEFVPVDGGSEVLVSAIESRQPEREHLIYWANGLTPVYLEGSLSRARKPPTIRVPILDEAVSDGPATPRVVVQRAIPKPEAVLDPFEIGARSLDILRQELTALNRLRLQNIIAAYDLGGRTSIASMSDAELVGFIVSAVESRLLRR